MWRRLAHELFMNLLNSKRRFPTSVGDATSLNRAHPQVEIILPQLL